jgi:hypothetical protein
MACSVTISAVFSYSNGPPGNVGVQGQASDCSGAIIVTVAVLGSNAIVATFPPATINQETGNWLAGGAVTVSAGTQLTVTATCSDNPNCYHTWQGVPSVAGTLYPCPALAAEPPVYGDCNADGTRTVQLQASVTMPPSTFGLLTWIFGDNSAPSIVFVGSSGLFSAYRDYQPGSYKATLATAAQDIVPCPDAVFNLMVPACPVTAGTCPQITDPTANISPTCNADGTRAVTLSANVTPPAGGGPVIVEWDYGYQNNVAQAQNVTSSGPVQASFNYPPGNYQAQLKVIFPPNCPSAPVTLNVPACPTTTTCPQVTNLTASFNGCAGQGNSVAVTFTGIVSPPPPSGDSCSYTWQFSDGTVPFTTSSPPPITHTFTSPGTYPVSVTVVCGPCIQPSDISVTIPPCCPSVIGLNATVAGCADGAGTSASVTLIATTNPPSAAGTYAWSFGDGSNASGPAASAVHSYASPGSFNATVSFQPSAPNCSPTSVGTTVSVPKCQPPGGGSPGGGGGGSFACSLLLVVAVVLMLLGALAILLANCAATVLGAAAPIVMAAGIVAEVFGAILFVIWAILCARTTPCDIMLTVDCLLVWMVQVIQPIIVFASWLFGSSSLCFLTALGAWGWYGFIRGWLETLMRNVGCEPRQCL